VPVGLQGEKYKGVKLNRIRERGGQFQKAVRPFPNLKQSGGREAPGAVEDKSKKKGEATPEKGGSLTRGGEKTTIERWKNVT